MAAAALACRGEPSPAAADAGAAPDRTYRMADYAAALWLDARVARLSLLASEYRAALAGSRGAALRRRTVELDARLDAAASLAGQALEAVTDPRDRVLAAPLVAAAQRWPALLRQARRERLAPARGGDDAARVLGTADAEVARALDAYRRSRNGWILVGGHPEEAGPAAFLSSRRALEQAEARLGKRLPQGPAEVGPDLRGARQGIQSSIQRARTAAEAVDPARRPAARAWVDAQGRALVALLDLAEAREPDRLRLSLAYQAAKVEALEAVAEWARLTAAPAPGR